MIDPGSPKKHDKYIPFVVVLALIFPSHHKPVVAPVPNVGSVGKHRDAVAGKPFCVRNAAVAGRQETLAINPRKLPSCSTNSASGSTDGGFGGACSECRPSSAIYRGERFGAPFPAPRTV